LRAFVTAYGLTIANPPTILFFAGLFASVATPSSLSEALFFSAGIFAGSMLWWLFLTTVVARSAARLSPRVLLLITRLSGILLIAFAGYGLASSLYTILHLRP
jgi:threonine/homoserine/homoserine lactone efflux protein